MTKVTQPIFFSCFALEFFKSVLSFGSSDVELYLLCCVLVLILPRMELIFFLFGAVVWIGDENSVDDTLRFQLVLSSVCTASVFLPQPPQSIELGVLCRLGGGTTGQMTQTT